MSLEPSLYPEQAFRLSQGNQEQVGSQDTPGLMAPPQCGAEPGHTHHPGASETELGLPKP